MGKNKTNFLLRPEVIKISMWLAKPETKELIESTPRSHTQIGRLIAESVGIDKEILGPAAKEFCEEAGIKIQRLSDAGIKHTDRINELEIAVLRLEERLERLEELAKVLS